MNVRPIDAVSAADTAGGVRPAAPASFGDALAAALGDAGDAVARADGAAALVAAGAGDVVGASIARAKADVVLEIASVTASRVSGAVETLLQTQV